MARINDIAILLTQKIESKLVHEFITNKNSPNFREIRETILKVLEDNIKMFIVETKDSPREMQQMPKELLATYQNHKLAREAATFAENIVNDSEIVHRFEYQGDNDWYKSTSKYFAIIKLQKMIDETDSKYFKDRW